MEQSSDGMPISQRRANSSTKHSSKSDEVAQDMLQSDIPHETVRHCQDAESEEIEGAPHKKIVHSFTESSSSKNQKHRWSSEEDEALRQMVNKHGTQNWQTIASAIPGRNANSCFSRWKYILDPAINKQPWSQQEELRLIRAQQVYGNKWCKMVKHFPGRTNDALKEHWRGSMKRKLHSYLASGLLENIPELQDGVSFPQSNQSDISKDCKAASDRNIFSSRLPTNPKLKQEHTEVVENGITSARKSSGLFYAKAPDTHSAKISEMTISKSQQCAGRRNKLAFLSTPVELKSVVQCKTTKHCQDMESEKTEGPPLCKRNAHCIKDGSSLKIPERTKGKWSAEEDEILTKMVTKHGKNWQTVAAAIPGREARQCRSRWTRSLDPAINKEEWSEKEELKLIRAHEKYGSQWLKMVKHFPGRTNHALKEHWRRPMKGKLNFYLASGLLEQVPDLEEDISVPESSQSEIPKGSVPESSQSDILKDSQGSSDRSQPPSVLRTRPKSKQEPPELDENAGTSEEETSYYICPKGPNAHSAKVSEKVLAKSKQRARARRKLDFLSTPVELKVCTAAASCQRPPLKMDQTSPVAENNSPSDVCQDISQNVPSERVDAVTPLAANNHQTADPFSLEMHEVNASDLLDMSYCDDLIIDSPRYPHDGSFI